MFFAALLLLSTLVVGAQTSARAVIEGRVINAATDTYLENARVVIDGTRIESRTAADGTFRLSNVPAGEVRVTVFYSGFESQAQVVNVGAGMTAQTEFSLVLSAIRPAATSDEMVRLEAFDVRERRLSGQALALNEERAAGNIKNVISFEEFGDMGESNPGEYLKYVPGLSINYGPNIPQFASIRGLPAEATMVTMDGGPVASSAGDRAFELTGAATSNIDRIEVTKSPTPDMPANSIGGSVNIVGKSALSVSEPQLNVSTYVTFNVINGRPGLDLTLDKRAGPDARTSARPLRPGFDLVYLRPVNERFGLTVSAGASSRYNYYDSIQTLWDLVRNVNPRLIKQDVIVISDRLNAGLTTDWQVSNTDRLRASFQYSEDDFDVVVSAMDYNFNSGASGDRSYTESRPNVGIVANTASAYNSVRDTSAFNLRYTHSGPVWRWDAEASYSRSGRKNTDTDHNTFSGFTARYTGLSLRGDGMDAVYDGLLPRITATNSSGSVNVTDGGGMPITAALAAVDLRTVDTIRSARFNVTRDLDTANPLRLKAGLALDEETLDTERKRYRSYTVAAPSGPGSNTGDALGVIAEEFSNRTEWYDAYGDRVPVRWISPGLLYDYYQANPQYFTSNDSLSHRIDVTNSKYLRETITAGYISAESRTFDNRLRVIAGVRYEKTEDKGLGPLDDIGATYQRDANGDIVRDGSGQPVRITNDPLELARLQYTRRGTSNNRSYDGFYPSLNGSFQLRENLALRFAYARTIARPPIREITPGITLSNPTSTSGTITQNNTGLRPWVSDSYDLSLEAYDFKGATITLGTFQKDLKDFFVSTTEPITPEFMAEFGLGPEYAGYDVVTKRNGGAARITGFEFSYRQELLFLPSWARGTHAFVNGTFLSVSGANADDFTNFSPQNVNWGVSYSNSRFVAKFNVARAGRVRSTRVAASATVPPDTYRYIAPQTTVDASVEWKFTPRFSLYASARNLTQSVKYTEDYAPTTPDYARIRVAQRFGAMFTLGVKGEF